VIYVLIAVHVIVCLLLIVIILLQQGKSADLAAAFGGQGSQTAFGPRSAANLLTKTTAWLAVVFVITSMTLTVMYQHQTTHSNSVLSGASQSAPAKR
jgi:preprotein translocase subunit SecG